MAATIELRDGARRQDAAAALNGGNPLKQPCVESFRARLAESDILVEM